MSADASGAVIVTGAGGRAVAVVADISDEAGCARIAETAIAAFGTIAALINNAAYFSQIKPKPFWELTVAEWDAASNVNLKGTWLVSRAVAPAGVVGLTRAMAKELGEYNVRVNCLAPGGTVTEIKRKTMTDEVVERLVGMQSLHRACTPEDLVGYVASLCSAEASFITGQTLVIDGGLHFN